MAELFLKLDRELKVASACPELAARAHGAVVGAELGALLPWADAALARELRAVFATGRAHASVRRIATGAWVEVRAYPEPDGLFVLVNEASAGERAEPRRFASRAAPARAVGARTSEPDALLRLIIDAVPALISYVDDRFRYRLANRAYLTWFGASPASIQGRPVAEVIGEDAWRIVEPRMQRALAGETVTYDDDLPYQSGGVRSVRATYTPDRDDAGAVRGVAVLVHDVSDLRSAKDALRESELMLARAQAMAHVGSWELALDDTEDINRNVLKWSDEGFRIFGFEPDEVEVTNDLFFALVHPDDRPKIVEAVATALRDGRPYEIDHRIRRRDGVERIVHEWGVIERDASGRRRRIVGTTQDVTEQRRAEQELRDADQRKDEFVATLAHELRNPLATVRNSLEILAMRGSDDVARERARTSMVRQVHHLIRLVDDLLDVTRMTRGDIVLRKQATTIGEAVAAALETVQPVLDQHGHVLTVSLPSAPLPVHADPVRLSQVIANLVSNAARYTPSPGRIEVRAAREGDEAVVRVIDDGRGLDSEALGHVFDPYYRGRASFDDDAGIGVGLTLAKRIVDLHQGRIEARSDGPGRGSEFSVRLPLGEAPAEPPEASAESAPARPTRSERRILIVDDNTDSAETLALLLTLDGHEARLAFDGAEALEAAAAFRPEVVILDLGMPGMSGYDVARILRQQDATKGVLLVALTGWGQIEHRRRTAEAGFDHHLVKPVDLASLRSILESETRAARAR